jgi:predicted nucleotidyltransferase
MKTVAETIGKIKEFRKGITLGGISVRELIEEGRRDYRPIESIAVPKESDKKVFPVAPVGFPPVTRVQLRRVGEKIAGLPGVEKVILFGSYARGNPTPDSDVDLLVVWKTRRPRTERWMAVSKLFSRRPFPMDIVVRTPRQIKDALIRKDCFIREVVSTGKVLFEKE